MNERRQLPGQRVAVLFAALSLAALIGGGGLFGLALHSGSLPLFYKPLWFGPNHALIVSNGGVCPPGHAENPCHKPTFRVTVWWPGGNWRVVSWPQQQ